MIVRALALSVFVGAACLVWLPFDVHHPLYRTTTGGAIPAGEIQANFELRQTVEPPGVGMATPVLAPDHCFGIRFATYARTNSGHLGVLWWQGSSWQRWQVKADDLADNRFRFFCPRGYFAPGRPFGLGIVGVDGTAGSSATLWLVKDRSLGTAVLSEGPTDRAITLQVTARHRIGPASLPRIDRGAFLFGWLCTLAIGFAALLHGFSVRRGRDS